MPHTLLLADDSVTIQRVIELTFADEDIRVVAVGDGDEAIAALDRTPPDIVLADVGMPGRNGYEVAQHIRDTPRLAHIPVLLLTGAFEPIDHERAAAVGCDGVLAKPFEPQLVISRVKELLARPKPIPVPADSSPAPAASWTSVFDEPTIARGPIKAPDPADVDHYFDRLDQAFANLSNASQDAPKPPARSIASEIDWFAAGPEIEAGASEGPGVAIEPPPAFDRWTPIAESGSEPVADLPLAAPTLEPEPPFVAFVPASAPTPLPMPLPPPPPALPPLADAFAALLAAEQLMPAQPPPLAPSPAWPPPGDAVISDAVIEDIVGRVMARLSDRVVRETVADIASGLAERLVREEIERIKSSIE